MKRIIFILIGALVLVGGAVVATLLVKEKPKENQTVQEVNVSGAERIAEYFKLASVETLNRAVAAQIEKDDASSAENSYEIAYREGSYTKTTTADGYPIARVVIDIPKLQRTYIVVSEGDSTTEYADLRVLCPAATDLIYKAQTCNDVP